MTADGPSGLASALLKEAAQKVWVDVQVTVQVLASARVRDIAVDPLVDWLLAAAATYQLYEGRDWDDTNIDSRVGPADRAALQFARSIWLPATSAS